MKTFFLKDELETLKFGAEFSQKVPDCCVIFLTGNLGAGKTTFVRGFLQGLGYKEKVKSPTYTLVEPYKINGKHIYHFDLYRLTDPQELDYMGARDYFDDSICIIEWPEKGKGYLPAPDIRCHFKVKNEGRELQINA